MSGNEALPAIEAVGIHKTFGAVKALDDVSIQIRRGEIVGLVGDNGAGKSTLVKCLAGGISPDLGSILIDGVPAHLETPQRARAEGIETVWQHLSLINSLDAAGNIFLNRELRIPGYLGKLLRLLDLGQMEAEANSLLERLSIALPDVTQAVARFSGGQRQAVAIARAMKWARRAVLMDEPAAALGVEQTQMVVDLIRRLKESDIGVLVISHDMDQIMNVADTAVVMRHGRLVASLDTKQTSAVELVGYLTGALEGG